MPRARFNEQDDWQTAAAFENGSGCLSFYSLSIMGVLVITSLIAVLALNAPPIPVRPATLSQADLQSDLITTTASSLSPIFTREVQYWAREITRWSVNSVLDPNLVAVVMQIESCGDPRARSRSDARGLFQVMPFHFHFGEDAYDPETNALRGMNYLARSFQASNGDVRLALAGYNGGIGVISRADWMWAAETKRYVQYGVPIYEDARRGNSSSPMLDEWYRKYGAGLCRQASERLGLD